MEFDHLRDKEFTISRHGLTVSIDRLKPEIAKCDVVCSNCHRSRTYARNADAVPLAFETPSVAPSG